MRLGHGSGVAHGRPAVPEDSRVAVQEEALGLVDEDALRGRGHRHPVVRGDGRDPQDDAQAHHAGADQQDAALPQELDLRRGFGLFAVAPGVADPGGAGADGSALREARQLGSCSQSAAHMIADTRKSHRSVLMDRARAAGTERRQTPVSSH